MPVFEHEYVVGLEVAVHDAARVRRLQTARDLRGYGERFAGRQRSPVKKVAQRLAVEKLRNCVTHAVVVAEVVNRQDVGVRNRRHRTRLALEACDAIGIGGEGFRQNLDRDLAAQVRIVSPIHFAHSAGADRADDFVGAEARAGHEGHV